MKICPDSHWWQYQNHLSLSLSLSLSEGDFKVLLITSCVHCVEMRSSGSHQAEMLLKHILEAKKLFSNDDNRTAILWRKSVNSNGAVTVPELNCGSFD